MKKHIYIILWYKTLVKYELNMYFLDYITIAIKLKYSQIDIRCNWQNFIVLLTHLSEVTYSQVWWPILRIRALHLPIQVHKHRHHEHTHGAMGSHLSCGARGGVGGSVSCPRAPQSWYWGWRESAVHSLPPPTIPAGMSLELTTFRLWVQLSNH